MALYMSIGETGKKEGIITVHVKTITVNNVKGPKLWEKQIEIVGADGEKLRITLIGDKKVISKVRKYSAALL
jgi:hypothetical protein